MKHKEIDDDNNKKEKCFGYVDSNLDKKIYTKFMRIKQISISIRKKGTENVFVEKQFVSIRNKSGSSNPCIFNTNINKLLNART